MCSHCSPLIAHLNALTRFTFRCCALFYIQSSSDNMWRRWRLNAFFCFCSVRPYKCLLLHLHARRSANVIASGRDQPINLQLNQFDCVCVFNSVVFVFHLQMSSTARLSVLMEFGLSRFHRSGQLGLSAIDHGRLQVTVGKSIKVCRPPLEFNHTLKTGNC